MWLIVLHKNVFDLSELHSFQPSLQANIILPTLHEVDQFRWVSWWQFKVRFGLSAYINSTKRTHSRVWKGQRRLVSCNCCQCSFVVCSAFQPVIPHIQMLWELVLTGEVMQWERTRLFKEQFAQSSTKSNRKIVQAMEIHTKWKTKHVLRFAAHCCDGRLTDCVFGYSTSSSQVRKCRVEFLHVAKTSRVDGAIWQWCSLANFCTCFQYDMAFEVRHGLSAVLHNSWQWIQGVHHENSSSVSFHGSVRTISVQERDWCLNFEERTSRCQRTMKMKTTLEKWLCCQNSSIWTTVWLECSNSGMLFSFQSACDIGCHEPVLCQNVTTLAAYHPNWWNGWRWGKLSHFTKQIANLLFVPKQAVDALFVSTAFVTKRKEQVETSQELMKCPGPQAVACEADSKVRQSTVLFGIFSVKKFQ